MATKSKKEHKTTKRNKKLAKLQAKYGSFRELPAKDLPKRHKAALGGGFRCVQKCYPRDKEGNKLREEPKYRCKSPAVKGSFFCVKHHGGNSYQLKHGGFSQGKITGNLYGRDTSVEFGDLLDAFMSDPDIMDLKPEVAALRTALKKYLEEVTSEEPKLPAKMLVKQIRRMTKDTSQSMTERFVMIRDLCASQMFITDGEALDRLNKTAETISRVMERMYRIQSQDKYFLTPDGLKMLIRSIGEIIKEKIPDASVIADIRDKLMEINTRTKGNIYREQGIQDAEYKEV